MKDQLYKALCAMHPNKVRCIILDEDGIDNGITAELLSVGHDYANLSDGYDGLNLESVKPILRDLSTLDQDQEINGEVFNPLNKLNYIFGGSIGYMDKNLGINLNVINGLEPFSVNKFWVVRDKLIEWHFNVFNLPKDQWVDIKTLNK